MIVIIAITIFLYLLYCYLFLNKTYKIPIGLKEIPCIKGLPLIGVIHRVKPTMHHFFSELSKSHGPIFRVKLGMREVIVLNNFDSIKKSLKDNGFNFSGRLKIKGFQVMSLNSGIVFTDGDKWLKQRLFFLKVIHDFGLGKSTSISIVQNECAFLLDELESYSGKSVDFAKVIAVYTANIISKFILNKRFSRGDPILEVLDEIVTKFARKKDPIELAHFLFPIFDNVEWIMKFSNSKKFNAGLEIFKQEIDEHRMNLDFDSDGEDLIDRFLIEQNHLKNFTGSVDTFTDSQLIRSSMELFAAGYETTSTTLIWSLMFMAKYENIQNKVHEEIIDQIGPERMTTMNDKKYLNYTHAVMDEIFRWSTPGPLAFPHRNANACDINGYFIPKDSTVIPNLFACHFDPEVWEKPDQFYPEHFLKIDIDGQMKYNPREELIPFSMGKRQCSGESLARMEYFIFFTSILQRFRVRFVEELIEKQYERVLIGNDATVRLCSVKDFIFKKR